MVTTTIFQLGVVQGSMAAATIFQLDVVWGVWWQPPYSSWVWSWEYDGHHHIPAV